MEPDSLFMPLIRTGLDPVAELGRRREEQPVSRLDLFGNTVWLVNRHADVRRGLREATTFSNDFANLPPAGGGAGCSRRPPPPAGWTRSCPGSARWSTAGWTSWRGPARPPTWSSCSPPP